jgi:hypothetical protein
MNNDLPNRSQQIRLLQKNIVTIKFKKSNERALRTMRCTLMPTLVPTYSGKAGGENKDVVAVFDLDKNQWRSYHVDALKKFTV